MTGPYRACTNPASFQEYVLPSSMYMVCISHFLIAIYICFLLKIPSWECLSTSLCYWVFCELKNLKNPKNHSYSACFWALILSPDINLFLFENALCNFDHVFLSFWVSVWGFYYSFYANIAKMFLTGKFLWSFSNFMSNTLSNMGNR